MPGKSRRRHPSRSKKRKMRQGFPVTGVQQQATAQNDRPVSQAPESAYGLCGHAATDWP